MADKKRRAEKLYDCIGGIRDDYIARAEDYTQNRFLYPKKLIASLAACVAVLIMVSVFSDVFIQKNDESTPDSVISLQAVFDFCIGISGAQILFITNAPVSGYRLILHIMGTT